MRTLRFAAASLLATLCCTAPARAAGSVDPVAGTIALPSPPRVGSVSLEQALRQRRSVRAFTQAPLALDEVARLLWAAQGQTDEQGHRVAPSAHATYPLDLLAIVGRVEGLPPGLYRYDPAHHSLERRAPGDLRERLAHDAVKQPWIASAPLIVVVAASPARAAARTGKAGERFVDVEAGLAAQGLLLEATALGLGATFVGGFDPEATRKLLTVGGASPGERIEAVLPVGRPAAATPRR